MMPHPIKKAALDMFQNGFDFESVWKVVQLTNQLRVFPQVSRRSVERWYRKFIQVQKCKLSS